MGHPLKKGVMFIFANIRKDLTKKHYEESICEN